MQIGPPPLAPFECLSPRTKPADCSVNHVQLNNPNVRASPPSHFRCPLCLSVGKQCFATSLYTAPLLFRAGSVWDQQNHAIGPQLRATLFFGLDVFNPQVHFADCAAGQLKQYMAITDGCEHGGSFARTDNGGAGTRSTKTTKAEQATGGAFFFLRENDCLPGHKLLIALLITFD